MGEERLGRRSAWPVRLVLIGVVGIEILIIAGGAARREALDLGSPGSGAGLVALCGLGLLGITWTRWVLVAALRLRALPVGMAAGSSLAAWETVRLGALAALVLYVGAALALASPLGGSMRSARGERKGESRA